jgi:hypothetical protein
MPEKPSRAAEYSKEQVQLVTATCLYVATILGDHMEQAVIVGGLVPSLLIDQKNLPDGADSHAGTMDLDMGLTLAKAISADTALRLARYFGMSVEFWTGIQTQCDTEISVL